MSVSLDVLWWGSGHENAGKCRGKGVGGCACIYVWEAMRPLAAHAGASAVRTCVQCSSSAALDACAKDTLNEQLV